MLMDQKEQIAVDTWLSPLGAADGFMPWVKLESYLELVDWTGRQIHKKKRGAIPAHLAPILERLDMDVSQWLSAVIDFKHLFKHAVGVAQSIAEEAVRAEAKWLQGVGA